MRSVISILSSIVFAAMSLLAPTEPALGDDTSQAASIDPRREWFNISKGKTDFEISDPALLPSRLALAAKQSACHYEEQIKETPVRFRRLGGRRLAFVFCWGVIGSHRVFDLSNLAAPTPVEFPVLAPPNGFVSTATPGMVTQDQDTGLFLADEGSDIEPSPRLRHTYRFDDYRGFVIVRVEIRQRRSDEWTTMWDAPPWSLPAASK